MTGFCWKVERHSKIPPCVLLCFASSLSVEEPPCISGPAAPFPLVYGFSPPELPLFIDSPSNPSPPVEAIVIVSGIDPQDDTFTISIDSTTKIAGFQCDIVSSGTKI